MRHDFVYSGLQKVLHGEKPTNEQVKQFVEVYEGKMEARTEKFFNLALTALGAAATAFVYLFCVMFHVTGGEKPFPDQVLPYLNPLAHPWLCLFLGTVWAVLLSILAVVRVNRGR